MNSNERWTWTGFLLLGLGQPALAQEGQAPARPEAQQVEGQAPNEDFVGVFVRMDAQLFAKGGDYERFCAAQPDACQRLELRRQVVGTLRELADTSFARVQEALAQLVDDGGVRGVQRYWVVNGFACETTAKARDALRELEGVGHVYDQSFAVQHQPQRARDFAPDAELTALYVKLLAEASGEPEGPFDPDAVEVPWNLNAVRASHAWREHGVSGQGVVVAVLDDGMMTIPTLLPALWRNTQEELNGEDDDGNGYIDDVFGYDFKRDTPYNVTPSGHRHGSLCASVVAARPAQGERPIVAGVAPRATIMPLVGNGQLRAYEYALDHGADVLSMSYTFEPQKMGPYRGLFRTAHEHLAAAGVVSVGGAGNYAEQRPLGTQIGSPKDIPCVIAAAGVGEDLHVTAFSSRGPVSWEGIRYFEALDALSKPDVTACNSEFPMWTLRELWTGAKAKRVENVVLEDSAGYVLAIGPRGNSFAGPHAAGVAALMFEADPQLPVWRLKRLMEATCADMGEPGRDTTSGAGLLQADKAVEAVRALR